MDFLEEKKLLKYYLDQSCAFSDREKSVIFARFGELPEEGKIEILHAFEQEVSGLQKIFS
jgi:hypothetical protein